LIEPEKPITCNFCGNPDPIYYCNKCNMVFCSTCKKEEIKKLALCASCGKVISEIHDHDSELDTKYKCYRCKSTRYIVGQKRYKYCPGCNQSDISTIAEKKRKLIETSRKLIYTFRDGYKEFYSFLKKLERVNAMLINLRTSGFFHDPRIETIMLKVINSIPIIKKQIMFRVEQDHKILKVPLQKFLDPTKWTPDKFFLLEASLNQIKEIMNNFRNFLDELIGRTHNDLNIAAGKLKAINYYKMIFDEYETLLDILPGELPICAFKKLKFRKSSFRDYGSGKGILFFTDRRMIFLKKRGILFKKYEPLFDFFLEGFEKVEIIGKIFKKLRFSLEEGTLKFSASEKIMRAIINYFKISINFDNYRADAEIPQKLLEPIDLDLLDLKQKIEVIITSLLSMNQISIISNSSDLFNIPNPDLTLRESQQPVFTEVPSPNIASILFKTKKEEYSLKNTLNNLETKFNERIISPEEYIRQFRHLQSELYTVRKRIEEIQRLNMNNLNLQTEQTPMRNLLDKIQGQNNENSNEKNDLDIIPLKIFD